MNENKSICPCCGKGCDLSNPACGRGEEYLRTGIIPPRGERGGQKHNHEHSHDEQRRHGNEHCYCEREHHHCKGEHDHERREHECKNHKCEHKDNRFSHYNEMSVSDKILAQMSKLTHQSHMIFGGRGGQKRILHILSKEGSITQRELTERLDIQPGSASEIIKKLENAGYILRTANEADRRTADISLTEAGKAQVLENGNERNCGALFSALSDDEATQLLNLLEKLSTDWDNRFKGHGHHHGPNHRKH